MNPSHPEAELQPIHPVPLPEPALPESTVRRWQASSAPKLNSAGTLIQDAHEKTSSAAVKPARAPFGWNFLYRSTPRYMTLGLMVVCLALAAVMTLKAGADTWRSGDLQTVSVVRLLLSLTLLQLARLLHTRPDTAPMNGLFPGLLFGLAGLTLDPQEGPLVTVAGLLLGQLILTWQLSARAARKTEQR